MEARDKIRRAFDSIYDNHPYMASIVASWKVQEVPDEFFTQRMGILPSAATDGVNLFYAKSFIDQLSIRETVDLIEHEAGHVFLGHHFRFAGKKPRTWNVAADLALNDYIKDDYDSQGIIFKEGVFPGSDWRRPRRIDPRTGSVIPSPFADYPQGLSAEKYFEIYNAQRQAAREKAREEAKKNPPQEKPKSPPQGPSIRMPMAPSEDEEDEDSEEDEGDSSVSRSKSKKTAGTDNRDSRASEPTSEKKSQPEAETAQSGEEKSEPTQRDDSATEGRTPRDTDDSLTDDEDDESDESDVPQMPGDVLAHPDSDDEDKIEEAKREWEQQVAEGINAAKQQGKLPGWAKSVVSEYAHESPINPEQLLRQFMTQYAPTATSYSRPNRRTAYRTDMILPAQRARDLSPGVIVMDTSGSMNESEMNQGLSLIEKACKLFPHSKITLVQADTRLTNEKVFTSNDFPMRVPHEWYGRGGTNLSPAIEELGKSKKYQWMIVISDMEWYVSKCVDPRIPVLWLVTEPIVRDYSQPKFGKVVPLGGPKWRE